jgi:ABC-2 type transport system ATP-binding protein
VSVAVHGAAAAVICRGLTKRFPGPGGGVLAVDALDLAVPAGSIVGLLGPNGAGKTTALRLITGLARATAGTVEIDGRTLGPDDLAGRRDIGVLDQAPRFYGWMRGRELVDFAARLAGLSPAATRAQSATVLERVGLADAAERRIAGYSGGMRQRLGIAAALVAEPRLLVLDEPVSALDPEGRRDVLALIAELRGSATVLFSSHVLGDVERVCDRVGILAGGRLVEDAPLPELLARFAVDRFRLEPADGQAGAVDALATRLSAAAWCTGMEREGTAFVVGVAEDGADLLLPEIVAAGLRVERFERVQPTLEDVFLRLVGRREPDGSNRPNGPSGPGSAG